MEDKYPYYLANEAQQPNADLPVVDKYTQQIATHVAVADSQALSDAIEQAEAATEPMRNMKPYERQQVLNHVVECCQRDADELAMALCIEAGKPLKDSRGEVTRLIDTLRMAAEESVRIYGEVMPLEVTAAADGYAGMWRRVPLGPCSFITPFNFPLNLVAHKIGPALAIGCPFILKPASKTPIGALLLGKYLAETDLPTGAFSILPMKTKDADPLVEDDRLKKLSFTGSDTVGWDMKRRCGKKHITLELGGNAALVIESDADVDDAVQRTLKGAFYQSGQSCISVQRIYIQKDVYQQYRDKLVAETKKLKVGDPKDEATFVGPIISEDDAKRIATWIKEAVDGGARILCGGGRDGVFVQPTLLENAPSDAKVVREEVFGPVAVLQSYKEFEEAIEHVNDSRFGLQAGIFTQDIRRIHRAWNKLDVGGVIINEIPSWRVDHMPYGGSKDSGFGREGIRWAIDSMTEPRLLVVRNAD